MFITQRIRDPVHDLIPFEATEFDSALWGVMQTRPFQRLRRVKQLGFSEFVYPGATHSRFAHSIGAFHIARRLMQIVERHQGLQEFRTSRAERALAAALVHDLGHGPFSHAFEDVAKRLKLKLARKHEIVSDLLIRSGEVAEALNALGSGFANDVADVIKKGPVDMYSAVVSSQFDADRLDYVQRDRLMSGTQHAQIDFVWLTANLEVGEIPTGVDEASAGSVETFVIGPKAIYAAEAYVLGLFQLYPTLYFHKATRGAEKLFSELFFRTVTLCRDASVKKTGLPVRHPIVSFARDPEKIDHILALDDTLFWGSLDMLADSTDIVISGLAKRLRDRKFYKAIDVRKRVRERLSSRYEDRVDDDRSEELEMLVDRVCADVGAKIARVRRRGDALPTILWDEAEREPYKTLEESKGPLNQITVKTQEGKLVDLRRLSSAVRSVRTFHLNRAYVPDEKGESATLVERLIKEGTRNVTHQ
jgi:uncharacterized protein